MQTRTIVKKFKNDMTDLIVDMEDIIYTLPKEMSVQDRQYFEIYLHNIREAIRELDIEFDLYRETKDKKGEV